MSDTNKIIEELTGALTSNTAELHALKGQVASQQDLLNEVRTHNQNVAKSVNWKNLGEEVFKGVSSATTMKIEEATQAARHIAANANTLGGACKEQEDAMRAVMRTIREGATEVRRSREATESLHESAGELSASVGAKMTHMLLVGLLTACLGVFGGYWWAKGNIEEMSFHEMGKSLTGTHGVDFCGYANGEMKTDHRGGTACFFWVTPNPAEPTE